MWFIVKILLHKFEGGGKILNSEFPTKFFSDIILDIISVIIHLNSLIYNILLYECIIVNILVHKFKGGGAKSFTLNFW